MAAAVRFKHSPSKELKAGPGFLLSGVDPESTPGYKGKKSDGVALLAAQDERLDELQEMLFAEGKFGSSKRVLLILQAMDTAGKGGIVEHVVGSMDPQGVKVAPFRAPTDEEKAHDFLWRVERSLPDAGFVGVFDRSHYEDVLIHRVHGWANEAELERRYAAINAFEARLAERGTAIVKVMLNISRDEQKERLLARLDDPSKHWKYSTGDLKERAFWDSYMEAYQLVFEKTSTEVAPWYVVPANKKWFARIAVQELLLEALEKLDLAWPAADFDVSAERALAVRS
ncbi:phosphate--nucleotide phosphotransferase [Arthrobacter sp. SRS-W-1-2016]|jgi:PPK2 family polyphosphate:nucleotide phosphotransferase|uniref:PPK2 family polyphosphate kinase n=1 Tax=Arthrobacter TaxID=1663 RepID=UPI000990CE37|nr:MULTISPECIES: PPK2 family polyphosphate kinase [Arthrobacter]MDQ0212815.1 PPK2 family polyphosphate:nucleotide phosphotransferase [Arthrobacter bambusae]MDQ0233713.1 PPK2 family polyphosphate:nucleotide phosphotransferase [Arthrobacter bambusae]OOP60332.1 phosphate--nucleotide phosphotransferase [Arthrobacter sp. SRS-W-1-2016]